MKTKIYIPVKNTKPNKEELSKARFWMNVNICDDNTCWNWSGSLNKTGYGHVRFKDKIELAHRVSYLITNGEIGDYLVLHKCDNPKCVNPHHLFLGSVRDNIHDMRCKGRGKRKTSSSIYHGVSFRTDNLMWRSYLILNKKYIRIGSFKSEIDAAKAYDNKVKELQLPFKLNFQ